MTKMGKQRKIAIAVDGSAGSVPLIKWAIKNSLNQSDEIHLLHSAASDTQAQNVEATATVNLCLSELAGYQTGSTLGSATSVLLDMKGDLRDKLVDYVEDLGGAIDLLVMGTRGMQGDLKRAVLGSVSSYCLSYASCPVIVVPADVSQGFADPSPDSDHSTPTA